MSSFCKSASGLKLCFDPWWPQPTHLCVRYMWSPGHGAGVVAGQKCCVFYCHCEILGLWRKKFVRLAPPICFVFHRGTLREWRTSLYVSQTVWDGMFMYFETLRKETGFRFWKPWGMCMGKPVWATGISSKRRNKAQVYRLHHRSGDSGFVIRNAMEKVFIVRSLTNFCSSGPVIHLQGLRFTRPPS